MHCEAWATAVSAQRNKRLVETDLREEQELPAFGWIGLVLLQSFYFPQTIKIVKTREVIGLSLLAWVMLWFGLLSYLVYSIYVGDKVFTAGNAAGLLQSTLVIWLILRYRTRAETAGAREH